MKRYFLLTFLIGFAVFFSFNYQPSIFTNKALAQNNQSDKTVVKSEKAKQMLLGKHRLQLQWLSFWKVKDMGVAEIADKNGRLVVEGKQTGADGFVELSGNILEVNEKDFLFDGKITMKVNYNNEGKPCIREGKMLFRITGQRKFWRLKDMLNPCDNTTTDYIDIFFADK